VELVRTFEEENGTEAKKSSQQQPFKKKTAQKKLPSPEP